MTTQTTQAADDTAQMPRQIPYIIASEGCERFSFYGMRNILTPFLTTILLVQLFPEKLAREAAAKEVFHTFVMGVYFFPILGGWLADRFFGKYNTILWFSLIYCVGHACLAIAEDSVNGFYIGLLLISLGAGGIKPLVASFMGDQFDERNKHLAKRVFDAFYWIINFGSFFASLLMPLFLAVLGPQIAFGFPGVLMFIATVALWLGRKRYVMVPVAPANPNSFMRVVITALTRHVPSERRVGLYVVGFGVVLVLGCFALLPAIERTPANITKIICGALVAFLVFGAIGTALQLSRARGLHTDEAVNGVRAVLGVLVVFALVTPFHSLFDQKATTWVLQGNHMLSPSFDFDLGSWGVWELVFQPAQMQAANPALVMLLIPFNNFVLYPWLRRKGWEPTPLRKMTVGILFGGAAWIAAGFVQLAIDGGAQITIMWQILPYMLLTFGEVLVLATGLEFAYSQAPLSMKGVIMSFWNLTTTVGNLWVLLLTTGLTHDWTQSKIARTGLSQDAFLIFFFAGFAFLTAIVFKLYIRRYKMLDCYRPDPTRAKPAPLPEARVRDDKK